MVSESWTSVEDNLMAAARVFVAKLLQTNFEQDRDSDESDDEIDAESPADGFLVCLVDALLLRLRGPGATEPIIKNSTAPDEGSPDDLNSTNQRGAPVDGIDGSAQEAEEVEEISDPRAQRVPSPRTSGGKNLTYLRPPTSHMHVLFM